MTHTRKKVGKLLQGCLDSHLQPAGDYFVCPYTYIASVHGCSNQRPQHRYKRETCSHNTVGLYLAGDAVLWETLLKRGHGARWASVLRFKTKAWQVRSNEYEYVTFMTERSKARDGGLPTDTIKSAFSVQRSNNRVILRPPVVLKVEGEIQHAVMHREVCSGTSKLLWIAFVSLGEPNKWWKISRLSQAICHPTSVFYLSLYFRYFQVVLSLGRNTEVRGDSFTEAR